MRKLQQVAIAVVAVGCLSTFGVGVSFADGYGGGPEAAAWATSASAAGAVSHGGSPHGYGSQAAPQAFAPQAPAPQTAPQAPAQAPIQQAPAPQAVAPQAPIQQAPAPQAVAPQAPAPQTAPQAPAPQTAPQGPEREHSHDRGDRIDVKQHTSCRSHDLNVDVLGQVGILNGLLGNALGGEGSPGAQHTKQGSSMGCNNNALGK
ncbi:hypothetical protein AB0C96_15770 [Streptomyces sp. NPDC048506]|uniref:hypothetical protein n=1 Tax=Streptomyces sp. NPDC048506 TaxID=3155028 RepID=UPI00342F4352